MIRAEKYDAELEELKQHEEIRAMADEVRNVPTSELESWPFIRGACDEAHKRGVPFSSIGAPAEAIRAVLEELNREDAPLEV